MKTHHGKLASDVYTMPSEDGIYGMDSATV